MSPAKRVAISRVYDQGSSLARPHFPPVHTTTWSSVLQINFPSCFPWLLIKYNHRLLFDVWLLLLGGFFGAPPDVRCPTHFVYRVKWRRQPWVRVYTGNVRTAKHLKKLKARNVYHGVTSERLTIFCNCLSGNWGQQLMLLWKCNFLRTCLIQQSRSIVQNLDPDSVASRLEIWLTCSVTDIHPCHCHQHTLKNT